MIDSVAPHFVPDVRYCQRTLLGLIGGLEWGVSIPNPLVRQCEGYPSRLVMCMRVARNLQMWVEMLLNHGVAEEVMKGRNGREGREGKEGALIARWCRARPA